MFSRESKGKQSLFQYLPLASTWLEFETLSMQVMLSLSPSLSTKHLRFRYSICTCHSHLTFFTRRTHTPPHSTFFGLTYPSLKVSLTSQDCLCLTRVGEVYFASTRRICNFCRNLKLICVKVHEAGDITTDMRNVLHSKVCHY